MTPATHFILNLILSNLCQPISAHMNSGGCHTRTIPFRIVCAEERGIGESVDGILPQFKNVNMTLTILVIEAVQFTNPYLDASWYNGTSQITRLDFTYCNIEALRSDAFSSKAFSMLKIFMIERNSYPIFLESNSLGRLPKLNDITTNSIVFGPEFVWGENRRVQYFVISDGLPGNISLEYLIAKIKLPNVRAFGIDGFLLGTQMKTLAPSNFTDLKSNKLQTLQLTECGIEIILPQTFDAIGKYLRGLYLDGNKIKNLYLEQFGAFTVGKSYSKTFSLRKNPIECDCNFYLVKSLWYINIRSRNFQLNELECSNEDLVLNLTEHCQRMQIQIIHTNKIHASSFNLDMNVLVYLRFNLKFDRERNEIFIWTDVMASFKVLMIQYKSGSRISGLKCQNTIWLKENTKCWLSNRKINPFRDGFYDRSEFTIVSVIHLTYLRVWPLHLMTIRTERQQLDDSMTVDIGIFSGISSGCLLLGFIGVICFKALKNLCPMKTTAKSVEELFSEEDYYETVI